MPEASRAGNSPVGTRDDDMAVPHFLHQGDRRAGDRPTSVSPWAHGRRRGSLSGRSRGRGPGPERSEEHTSELQSRGHLVCRPLLEKKNQHEMAAFVGAAAEKLEGQARTIDDGLTSTADVAN